MKIFKTSILAILVSLSINCLFASEKYSTAIEDNSFLIEEAYNQEPGIVQHIFTGMQNFTPIKNWEFTFTQEWPLWSQTHQFSYTLAYGSYNSGAVSGFGDIMLNYRYQMLDSDDWCAFSPRLSIIVPTGDEEQGLGSGKLGFQVNLPFSKRLAEQFTAHFNLGTTIIPGIDVMTQAGTESKMQTSLFTGGSLIWLASYNLNIMLECLVNLENSFDYYGESSYNTEFIINPGFRYAIDVGDLQIVPGIAIPLIFTESVTTSGIFLYLSLEHPF